uniref:Aminopeptidase n=1 Tax=Cynoglossus semilaevis TaxID=244447 RepID=A0A3P8VR49_CYNSE
MGKVYYISKNVGLGLLVLGVTALATIIALSAVYHKEKAKNLGSPAGGSSNDTSTSTSTAVPSTTTSASKELWDHFRLPGSIVPVTYNVTLWPRLTPDADGLYIFTGHSVVVFHCVKETDLVIIHSNKLNLTGPGAAGLGHVTAPAIQKHWFVENTEYLVLQLSRGLAVGATYALHTEFQGELADDLQGFYRSEYEEDGVKKIVAASQMQATFARKAFPCFDEPAMKAVFNITIIHDPSTVALSNGKDIDVADTVIDGIPVKVTKFEPTQKMSTYLLAFIVSDFVSIESRQNHLLIRIWGRKKAINNGQGEYALNVTGPILQFYERYYNASYPLSKSDQVALPDFNAGAMENWGLVTYRETALLYDPLVSSIWIKKRITSIIAHELAHMWFGNLVTLRWWNDLWLNEGFASYVEYLGTDYAEPTWNIRDYIVQYDLHKVFLVDALASSHPLSCPEEEVSDPAQINEMFDSISYSKGAAVLRMLSEFLTEPVFARGLSSYLNTYAFGNTIYTDLWDHLQQAVDNTPGIHIPCSVHDIMNRWTLQMGFPVVTIDTRTGRITQKHFLLDPDSVVERVSQFNYTWFVPIKWMKAGVEQQQYWLLQETGQDWVLANTNVSGYFRVNYDLENWERLLSLLNTNHQVIINRAQIIDDAFNLVRAKIVNTTLALRTTKYLHKERDYIPWESALRNLRYYIFMFERTEVFGDLQAYLKQRIQPLYEHYRTLTANWTKVLTLHTDVYNHITVIDVACVVGVRDCKEFVKTVYREWMDNPVKNPIQPDLRSTIYCNAIALGGMEEWDFAWRMFQNTTVASEASLLRGAMTCTKLPWLLNKYLGYTLDPNKIRKQDATATIQRIASNIVGLPLVWNFVRDKWSFIYEQYGKGSFSFSGLISGVTRRFSTEFELQELKRFKEDHSEVGFGSATVALEQAIEKITANIKWMADNKDQVWKWLKEELS